MRPGSRSTKLRASWVDLPAPAQPPPPARRRRLAFGRRRLELSLCSVALAIAAGAILLVAAEADPVGAPRGGPPPVIWSEAAAGWSAVAGPEGLAQDGAAAPASDLAALPAGAPGGHPATGHVKGDAATGAREGTAAGDPSKASAKGDPAKPASKGDAAETTGRIAGRVVAEATLGETPLLPPSGIVAVARPKKGAPVRTEVDPQGAFELAGLAPGEWTVSAEAPVLRPGDGLASSRAQAKVVAGKTAQVELGLVAARQGLSGVVLAAGDGADAAVAGARVTIELGGHTPIRRRVRTEADGRWSARELPEGVYAVRAEAEGFVTASHRRVAVAGGATTAPPLRLATEARLTGAVRGPDGQPAARADVVVLRERRELARARTDARGAYTIARLADGAVDVVVTTRDRGLAGRASATVGAGQTTTVDLALAAPPRVVGRVVGVDGQPRAGVRIDARARDGRARAAATSGDDGSFALAGLAPGGWTLTVPRRGAPAAARAGVDVPDAATGPAADVRCELVVKDGAILRGAVVGPDGGPLANALVVASVGGRERSRTRSDGDGAFQLVGLPGGDVNLFVRGPKDACVGTQDVVARADALLDGLRLVARPPARARGQVTDPDGLPLAGVAVDLRGGPVRRAGTTDDAGRFDLGPLYDGAYSLSVSSADLSLVARRRNVAKVVAEPQPLEVTLGRDVTCAVRSVDVRVEQ